VLALVLMTLPPAQAAAWNADGHAAIGVLAVEQASPDTRTALAQIFGDLSPDAIAAECTWADDFRETPAGRWSAPLHYVNIDPDSKRYSRQRDCPEDACVVEAVRRYAEVLGDDTQANETRREAFRFLCHFSGDLHQPLHIGYADDKGGNLVTVRFRGDAMNLHAFWDHALPAAHASGWRDLVSTLRKRPNPSATRWNAAELAGWTNETFSLTRNFAYPPTRQIDNAFARRGWQVALQQMDMAAERLALILETELAE